MNTFNSLCGNTPLIRISDNLYGKLESYNPTGSVKDRVISFLIRKAIKNGEITKDTILCEATSGNTGISLSSAAASLGMKCKIFMPKNMSKERRSMMTLFGAEIVDAPDNDFEAAIKMRDEFLLDSKDAWSPMQFSNMYNIECHKTETAPEIRQQVEAEGHEWGAFIHGSGTGGTIEGIRQYVSENKMNTILCMTVPAEDPHGIQGIGDGKDFLAFPDKMHHVIKVPTDSAIDRAKKFAKDTGLLVGISSGANIVAAEKFLSENNINGIAIVILADRGERYLSVYES